MIKAVIFDADGVVALNKTLRFSERFSQDFHVDSKKIIPFFKNEFQKCLVGKADLKEEIQKYLHDWNWNSSVDELLRYWFEKESYVNEKILSSLGELRSKGMACYLTTSNEKYRTTYLSTSLGLNKYFTTIFSTSNIGFQKHEPEFWESVLLKLKEFKKQEILVWDDDPENIETAKKCGLRAELYTDFTSYQQKMKVLLKSM